jgi:hypothetical protein
VTAQRYRHCLKLLRLTHIGLGRMVGSSHQLLGKWASGERRIPQEVADWLEACVKIRLEHPYPPPPRQWRQRTIRGHLGIPTIRIGNQRIW